MDRLTGRGISEEFIADLKDGALRSVLHVVLRNDALCLELREGYINLYYRGGSMLAHRAIPIRLCGRVRSPVLRTQNRPVGAFRADSLR